jgi:PAS domain S-box-containing protein
MQKTGIDNACAGPGEEFPVVIAAMPASDQQRKIALGVFITMALVAAITLPFAKVQLVRIDAFVPAVQFVICAANLFTAVLMFAQYSVYPQRALLALASGFVFSGLFAFLEACLFPGTSASTNLIYIGDELNSAAWLFTFWHTVFPLSVIVYALTKEAGRVAERSSQSIGTIIGVTIACVFTVSAGLTWLATVGVGYLPSIYSNANVLAPFVHYSAPFLFLLSVTTLVLLFVRRHSILDQWLLVVLLAWLPTFAVAAMFPVVRFTAAWYVARLYALFAGSALLFVLLTETVVLYTRLANAIVQLRRAGRVERRLAAIVESSDDAIISTDINGLITTWNKAAERLFGYCEAEVVGRPIAILVPPDRQKEIEKLQRVRVGESLDRFETVRQRKDGRLVNISLTVSPISEFGKIVGSSKIVRDITERKRAEDELRASKAELQGVLNQTPFMLVRCSRDLRYRFISQAYARWIDLPRQDVLGATIVETIGNKAFNTLRPYIEQVLQGTPVDFECEMEFRGVGKRCLNIAYRPESDAAGNINGWIASLLDVTERKRAEDHQGKLVAELDHRVKNILAQLAAVANSTRKGSSSIDEFLESLDGRIRSMAIAHTLLSAAGWRSVGLSALVSNLLAPYATGTNFTISGTDVVLDAGETQAVARVLHELATNAAKYGALSIPGGQVFVNWDLKLDGALTKLIFVWCELGGPPVASAHPCSYGTNLIRNLIPHELAGTVDLVFAKEGVNCRIEVPVKPA